MVHRIWSALISRVFFSRRNDGLVQVAIDVRLVSGGWISAVAEARFSLYSPEPYNDLRKPCSVAFRCYKNATKKTKDHSSFGIKTLHSSRRIGVLRYLPCPACSASGTLTEHILRTVQRVLGETKAGRRSGSQDDE